MYVSPKVLLPSLSLNFNLLQGEYVKKEVRMKFSSRDVQEVCIFI
jgi:hypothetical protein